MSAAANIELVPLQQTSGAAGSALSMADWLESIKQGYVTYPQHPRITHLYSHKKHASFLLAFPFLFPPFRVFLPANLSLF